MAHTACLVCFISTVNGHCNKKRKEKKKLTLGRPALVAGTQQTLSNLFCDLNWHKLKKNMPKLNLKQLALALMLQNTFRRNLNLSQNDNNVRKNHPFVKKVFLLAPRHKVIISAAL
jgi:hypothetical protein